MELVLDSVRLAPQLWGKWLVGVEGISDFAIVVNGFCKKKMGFSQWESRFIGHQLSGEAVTFCCGCVLESVDGATKCYSLHLNGIHHPESDLVVKEMKMGIWLWKDEEEHVCLKVYQY